jgi:hypothetical protein
MISKEKVVRPGGLELPTFWFVEIQESQSRKSISFVWRRLRISGNCSSLPTYTQFCTQITVGIVPMRLVHCNLKTVEQGRTSKVPSLCLHAVRDVPGIKNVFYGRDLAFCAALSAFIRRAASATESVCTSEAVVLCSGVICCGISRAVAAGAMAA